MKCIVSVNFVRFSNPIETVAHSLSEIDGSKPVRNLLHGGAKQAGQTQ